MEQFNILDFIDSEDIREHNKETLFSPTQKAILISRSQRQCIENKIKAMDSLLLENLDWDFSYIDADDKKKSFREVISEEIREWKEVLEKRYDNKDAVYIARLSEVEFLSSDDRNPRFFSNYAKAYESLVLAKKKYLDDLALKDVQTLGEIIRITVDAGNASYGYDERHYLFDTDMRLIDVYRRSFASVIAVLFIGGITASTTGFSSYNPAYCSLLVNLLAEPHETRLYKTVGNIISFSIVFIVSSPRIF